MTRKDGSEESEVRTSDGEGCEFKLLQAMYWKMSKNIIVEVLDYQDYQSAF